MQRFLVLEPVVRHGNTQFLQGQHALLPIEVAQPYIDRKEMEPLQTPEQAVMPRPAANIVERPKPTPRPKPETRTRSRKRGR